MCKKETYLMQLKATQRLCSIMLRQPLQAAAMHMTILDLCACAHNVVFERIFCIVYYEYQCCCAFMIVVNKGD